MKLSLRQLGLTPGKGALIALLTVGLLAVWGPTLAKLLKPKQSQPAPRATASAPVRPAAPATTAAATAAVQANSRRVMPEIGLIEASVADPFAIPEWSPLAKSDVEKLLEDEGITIESKFAALRQTGVAMVLVSGGERVVQIGQQTLRVGDEIEGFRLVEINDSGAVFSPVSPRESARGT